MLHDVVAGERLRALAHASRIRTDRFRQRLEDGLARERTGRGERFVDLEIRLEAVARGQHDGAAHEGVRGDEFGASGLAHTRDAVEDVELGVAMAGRETEQHPSIVTSDPEGVREDVAWRGVIRPVPPARRAPLDRRQNRTFAPRSGRTR